MKKSILKIAVSALLFASGHALAAEDLKQSLSQQIEAADVAAQSGDYAKARESLASATEMATRLDLQRIAEEVAAVNFSRGVEAEGQRFVLAASTTLEMKNLLRSRNAIERILKDPEGRIVKLRVIGDDNAMAQFMDALQDSQMLISAGLERAEMGGATALKRRKEDGGLSVLMMDEANHALIELDGDSEAAVMAIIEHLERQATL
ncbi:MAG: hypothetical protein AAF742_06405 [Pseudomonadota bacterium]